MCTFTDVCLMHSGNSVIILALQLVINQGLQIKMSFKLTLVQCIEKQHVCLQPCMNHVQIVSVKNDITVLRKKRVGMLLGKF